MNVEIGFFVWWLRYLKTGTGYACALQNIDNVLFSGVSTVNPVTWIENVGGRVLTGSRYSEVSKIILNNLENNEL